MWHLHKSSDARSKRFKIVVALATGLYWMSSGTVIWQTESFTLQSRASAESLSVAPQPTLSLRSANQTRKLARRPSTELIPSPSPQSTSPSTSGNQTRNKLIRRPSTPQAPATSTASTTTPTASTAGSGTASTAGASSELTTSTKSKTTSQVTTAIGSVTVPTIVQSFQSPQPSASANMTPLASVAPVGKLSTAPNSGSPSGNAYGYSRKLTQRPEVEAILSPPTQTASPPPPPSPTIGLSPTSLGFTGVQGGANPSAQIVSVTNTGGGTLSWSVSDNAAWLSLSPASGTAPGSATVGVNTSGLTVGTYNATITVTATGATNTPQTVPVSLTVTAAAVPPTIGLSPSSLSFTGVQGGANPANQTLGITNTGGGAMSWSVSDNATWLSLSPNSGSTAPGTVAASVSLASLTAGTYNATITVTASGATNTPRTVPVALTVTAPPTTGTATLTWNASTSTDATSYKVYSGTSSGVYGPPISVGNVTTYQATNLLQSTTYFFAVTAVDTSGNESVHSNEVSKSIF